MACMVALSMVAAGVPAATAGGDAASNSETIHTLEDGEELYLVFGADLGDMTLEEYVDEHADGSSSAVAEVIQHQDVDQVNINEQGSAASIAIDGGEATAIQQATQQNDNVQTGEATAGNVDVRSAETQFENVGTVNIIIGNGGDQQFDGWGIKDKKGDDETVTQKAIASVTQSQAVGQVNYNNQSTAFAYAANDSEATALQQSLQRNENLQEGMANASNVYLGDGEFGHAKDKSGDSSTGQSAAASVDQSQDIEQANVNEQGSAVAIAIGENSTATAIQLTEQSNLNEQFGSADATNLMVSSLGMNVATAGDVDGDVLSTETDMHGPDKKDKKDDVSETEQTATAGVAQDQEVEQRNINLQNTAMAMAENGSEATAIQFAHQQNYNAQVAYADALNVYASPGYVSDAVTRTSSTTVTVDGTAGTPGTSYDYAGNATQTNDVEQEASAAIAQQQFVTQENLNEQHTAVAVAEDGGSASSAQVTLQENENVQLASVASTNTWVGA